MHHLPWPETWHRKMPQLHGLTHPGISCHTVPYVMIPHHLVTPRYAIFRVAPACNWQWTCVQRDITPWHRDWHTACSAHKAHCALRITRSVRVRAHPGCSAVSWELYSAVRIRTSKTAGSRNLGTSLCPGESHPSNVIILGRAPPPKQ